MGWRIRKGWLLIFSAFSFVFGIVSLVGPEAEIARADSARSRHVVDVSRYRAQLFLHDNRVVDWHSGLDVAIGRIEKHPNPVLVPDKPWELGTVGYTCVMTGPRRRALQDVVRVPRKHGKA